MSRRRRPLVADSRHGLDALKAKVAQVADPNQAKYEVARELHVPLQNGYNGQLSSHDAGRIGGRLGGGMVKEMIRMGMQAMLEKK
ncbi:small, acid-soluble spore protein, alpha/beta type [Brevibacillus choshinensis]|uniref:Alpha/beta-type small acid-soluble spore protein n=1 Tax=Brevibacillus choshinensis TaxID=54911 RepID=A0ABX7FVU2_BRECH|nr:small, acid-soluble spore protein, alpha/beta type [Brevibacillus choshinensis]QRG69669.1 alpha/beta-type small acid-soluble spore protein [Brevibacillus choshinensis]